MIGARDLIVTMKIEEMGQTWHLSHAALLRMEVSCLALQKHCSGKK